LTFLSCVATAAAAAPCESHKFSGGRVYAFCNDLPVLNSSLYWSYNPGDGELSVAFCAAPPSPGGWVSWAINPTGAGMKGAQALLAFKDSDGMMKVKTYNITGYGPLTESKVWFDVEKSSAEFSGGFMRIFATLRLPEKGLSAVNHLWQVGPSVTDGRPNVHGFSPDNLKAMGRLDLSSGHVIPVAAGDSKLRSRNIHGILNTISWGILFPVGILIARYLRSFPGADPAWFYLHVSCQIIGYAIGVAGWATGMYLGNKSKGVTFSLHRSIGIALFTLATLQIFALRLRPGKDHKYRIYWNVYHHGAGYAILVMGIFNVFKGLDILKPGVGWTRAYTAVVSIIGGVALVLEATTWILYFMRRKKENAARNDG
ncbi:hypothetical protein M569_07445, partial [Genlisea aurea]